MVELVRPGDCQELLPPTRGNERDVEPKDKGERDEGEKGVEISHNALEKPEEKNRFQLVPSNLVSPLLHRIHHLSVDCSKNGVYNEEEKEFATDELVQRSFPLKEKPGESSCCGRGHVSLV